MKYVIRMCVLVLIVFFIFGLSKSVGQLFFLQNPFVGKKAPDFTLKTLQHNSVNMTQYREGKSAILFFWATWCPHCRDALKELNEGKYNLEAKDIKLILIDLGESEKQVGSYVEKHGINFDIFVDVDSSLSEKYGIIGLPTFFFVNREGIIQAVEHAIPDNYEEILSK